MGNPTARIFLSLQRMSTVKIRAGSLFCTTRSRNGAGGAGFGAGCGSAPGQATSSRTSRPKRDAVFLSSPQPRTALHRLYTGTGSFLLAGRWRPGAKSENTIQARTEKEIDLDQDTGSGLPAMRRHRMENTTRPLQRSQGPAGHAVRLPTAGAVWGLAGSSANSQALRTLRTRQLHHRFSRSPPLAGIGPPQGL